MQTHPLEFGRHAAASHDLAHGGNTGARRALHHSASHVRPKLFGNQYIPTKTKDQNADPDHAALVKQTEKWVAQTFFGQLLKQMRDSPFKSKTFSGGRGGEAFQQMFDQKLADHMSKGAGRKLVDAVVWKIEHPHGADGPPAVRKPTAHGRRAARAYGKQS